MGPRRLGKKPRTREVTTAARLVQAILAKYGIVREVRETLLVTRWREIVGERIAARARPDGLRNGVLYVRAASSAWLHELSFLKDEIRQRANEATGNPPLVREVRFHLGRGAPVDDGHGVGAPARPGRGPGERGGRKP